MDNILPLDVFTHIIDHANHESLLALRLTCRNIKELVSPLLFASIRVVCSTESFQRLDDLAEKNPELSRLVLDLMVDCVLPEKGEDVLTNLWKALVRFQLKHHVQFPSLCSMVVRFSEITNDSLIDIASQSWHQVSVLICLLSTFMRLRRLKIIRVPMLFQDRFSIKHLSSISSFTLTNQRQMTRFRDVPSAFSSTLESALRALSPEKLTTLRLETKDTSNISPLIPINLHFPNLTTLTVEGFELDAENVTSTHTDFAGFITRHRASLDRLALVDCALVCSYMHLDVGERVQAWVEKVGLSSVVHYQCEPL